MGVRHIELSAYALERGLILERDAERGTSVVDVEALRDDVSKMLDVETLILDGHYAHELTSPDSTRLVFVLRRAPWTLLGELLGRGYSPEKTWENVDAELLAVCLSEALERFPPGKVCELDTTGAQPQETLKIGLVALERGGCPGAYTDWVSRPETDELLRVRPCTS
jgi:adenylate kinase